MSAQNLPEGNKKKSLDSRASTSNHMVSDISSQKFSARVVNSEEIILLEERVRILEKEAEILKKTLGESLKERNRLMAGVYEYFETLQECLLHGEQEIGEIPLNRVKTIKPLKDRKVGLLQVLCEDSNPSLVTRDLRAREVAN